MKFSPFFYKDGDTPPEYVCGTCGAGGVRLYREYNTFLNHQTLLCRSCVILEDDTSSEFYNSKEHQLGWRMAAVPTEDGMAMWGFPSVPNDGVQWWDNLPKTINK